MRGGGGGGGGGGEGWGWWDALEGQNSSFTGLIGEPCTEVASIMGQAMGRMKLLMDEKMYKYKNNKINLKDSELSREMGGMGGRDG